MNSLALLSCRTELMLQLKDYMSLESRFSCCRFSSPLSFSAVLFLTDGVLGMECLLLVETFVGEHESCLLKAMLSWRLESRFILLEQEPSGSLVDPFSRPQNELLNYKTLLCSRTLSFSSAAIVALSSSSFFSSSLRCSALSIYTSVFCCSSIRNNSN